MRIDARCLCLAPLAAGILGLTVQPASTQDFTFDRQRPFAVADRDVSVREITYAGPAGEATEATLVAPVAPGRHPAVLFVHWYGPQHTTSNRTQYVPDALALARHGIVSLLVDTPWSEPSWFPTRQPENDVTFSASQVKRLQRAVDVLASLDGVDAGRLALVGHDFGAMYGAIVAGLDRRITTFAFVAGTAKFADWFLLGRKLDTDARTRVYDELAPYDPVRHLPKVSAGAVLLQFATKDPYVHGRRGQGAHRRGQGAEGVEVLRVRARDESGGHGRPRRMADTVAWRSVAQGFSPAKSGACRPEGLRYIAPSRRRDCSVRVRTGTDSSPSGTTLVASSGSSPGLPPTPRSGRPASRRVNRSRRRRPCRDEARTIRESR